MGDVSAQLYGGTQPCTLLHSTGAPAGAPICLLGQLVRRVVSRNAVLLLITTAATIGH